MTAGGNGIVSVRWIVIMTMWLIMEMIDWRTRPAGLAPQQINMLTFVQAIIVRKFNRQLPGDIACDPDVLARAKQSGQPSHHVVFDVTVDQEITLDTHTASVWRRIALQLFEQARQPQRRRRFSIGNETFRGAQTMHIGRTTRRCRQLPSRRMR